MTVNKIFLFVFVSLILMHRPAVADQDIDLTLLSGIPYVVFLQEDIVGGGVPSQEALEEIKRQGFKSVIDLRTMIEGTLFEQTSVKKLGIKYYNIPIHGFDISQEKVNQLAEILSDSKNRPALIHCAVGERVHALWGQYKKSK